MCGNPPPSSQAHGDTRARARQSGLHSFLGAFCLVRRLHLLWRIFWRFGRFGVRVRVRVRVRVHVRVHVCGRVHVRARMRVCVCVCTYMCACVCVCECVRVWFLFTRSDIRRGAQVLFLVSLVILW